MDQKEIEKKRNNTSAQFLSLAASRIYWASIFPFLVDKVSNLY